MLKRHKTSVSDMLQMAGVESGACKIVILPLNLQSNEIWVKVAPKAYPDKWKTYKFPLYVDSVRYPE